MNAFDWFEECFFADLDSWFSADIACCDNCYDEFLKIWPHVRSADDKKFQKSGIPLSVFYEGSRLRTSYSKIEFDRYIKKVRCPRCRLRLKANIWVYNFPFDVDSGIEKKIEHIAGIASKTPFLLLADPFANRVLEAIKTIALDTIPSPVTQSLFKGRPLNERPQKRIREFDFPPKTITKEGRYNHAGSPVLYLASDVETCFSEIDRVPCLIAEIQLNKELMTLDLIGQVNRNVKSSEIIATLTYSMLLSARHSGEGWHQPMYVFSRFLADCARHAGFDAIKYPSVQITGRNFNIAVINPEMNIKCNGGIIKYFKKE
jgi:hypothetical protein